METVKLLWAVQGPSGYHLIITNHLVIHFDTLHTPLGFIY